MTKTRKKLIEGALPVHGARAICYRIIYLGSASTPTAANSRLEGPRVRPGCVMPDESRAVVGDALRRLAGAAT
jgi:hypothetical protein